MSDEFGGYPLFILMLHAPLSAMSRDKNSRVIHAVTMDAIGDCYKTPDAKTVKSACGEDVALIGIDGQVAVWPPRVRGIKDALPRCKKCYELTGKPKPKSVIAKAGAA